MGETDCRLAPRNLRRSADRTKAVVTGEVECFLPRPSSSASAAPPFSSLPSTEWRTLAVPAGELRIAIINSLSLSVKGAVGAVQGYWHCEVRSISPTF